MIYPLEWHFASSYTTCAVVRRCCKRAACRHSVFALMSLLPHGANVAATRVCQLIS